MTVQPWLNEKITKGYVNKLKLVHRELCISKADFYLLKNKLILEHRLFNI